MTYEWQNLSTFTDIIWYSLEEGENLMSAAEPAFRKFVGAPKELIIRSSVNGDGSAIYNIFLKEINEKLQQTAFITKGNKFLFGYKMSILIELRP